MQVFQEKEKMYTEFRETAFELKNYLEMPLLFELSHSKYSSIIFNKKSFLKPILSGTINGLPQK